MGARLLTAAAAVALLTVAGCTSDGAPVPAPLPSQSPTERESASPSPAAPTLPAAAKGTSPAAAKAFARHYVDSVNHGMSTGDTGPLRDASANDCRVCNRILEEIEVAYANGGRLEGGTWEVLSSRYLRIGNGETQVGLGLRITKQTAYASESASPTHSRPTRGYLDIRATHAAGSWKVTRLDATS